MNRLAFARLLVAALMAGGSSWSLAQAERDGAAPARRSAVLEISLRSETGGTDLPFTFGQALRQGDVPLGSTLQGADLPGLQVVVKNRWPDGSAKFAIVSARIELPAEKWRDVTLRLAGEAQRAAPLATSELKSVSATVQFGSFGTAAWTASDWGTPAQTWISGPEMSSWLYRKPIGNDAHLVAWIEVRAYRGGRIEFLPWIENGYLNVPSPGARSGVASFLLNGSERFAQPLHLLNHQRAVLAGGTTLTHWLGADPRIDVRHDVAYLAATRIVPHYRGRTRPGSPLFSRLPSAYVPLAKASFPDGMGAGGYDASIGLLPEWDVAYLTSNGDPRAYRSVLINGYAAGRYGIHYRDETTQRQLRFSKYPRLVMGPGSGVASIGASTANAYTPTPSGEAPPTYKSSHHPSMGFMAYLLSGREYYLAETQFLASANFLKNGDATRRGSEGVFETAAGANTTRGAAWAIRTLAQAATITPDGDAMKAEFVASLDANIAYYHHRYVETPANPLGLVQPYSSYSNTDPWTSSVWMDDFVTATFGYLKDLQACRSELRAPLDRFLAWKYRSVVGRLGGSGEDQYSYRYAAQYTLPYAKTLTADWAKGSGPWYASWGEVARAMGLPTSGEPGESLVSGHPLAATGYWSNLLPAISYAVDDGAPGATEAWHRIVSASNFAAQARGYDDAPVWGVEPRGESREGSKAPAAPADAASRPARTSQAPLTLVPVSTQPMPSALAELRPGQWLELPDTKIRSVLPDPPQRGSPRAIVTAWNGGTVDTRRGRLLVWGGGHADYWGNEMYALDLASLAVKRIVEPSPDTAKADCKSALPDGEPVSRHTYDGLAYIAHADSLFSVDGSKSPCGFGETATWTYDFGAKRWSLALALSPTRSHYGTMAVYDAQSKQVYVKDTTSFFAYSPESNRYTKLNGEDQPVDYHLSATIDTKRRKFVMLGDGVQVIDLVTHRMTTMKTTQTPALATSRQSPGVAYDPVADRIVAWHGGSEVYALDMDSGVWTQVANNAGPAAPAPVQGTFGRWGYVPQYRVFALVNDIDQNGWVFRLR
jgi:hypothetical protein